MPDERDEQNNQNRTTHNVEMKELPNSEVEIMAEISAEEFEAEYARAIKKLGASVEVPGFRKGHVPENILTQKIGEGAILQEMAELAIAKAYPKIVTENKIEAIGRPEITVTKLARGNPLSFKAKTVVMPKVELPDYKTLAGKVLPAPAIELVVSDKEVDEAIDALRKNFAKIQRTRTTEKQEDARTEEQKNKETERPAGDGILGPDGKPVQTKEQKNLRTEERELPEVTDEFVRQLGPFETVLDFKKKVRENIVEEKKKKSKDKQRMEMMEAILKDMKVAVPQVFIESELQKMLAEFKGNIAAMGFKPEEYFEKLGKREEEIKNEWRGDAEKRAKTHLVLHAIAEKEDITVPEEELKRETDRLLQYHKDAPRDRARNYLFGVLRNERVFQFLEGNNPNNANHISE